MRIIDAPRVERTSVALGFLTSSRPDGEDLVAQPAGQRDPCFADPFSDRESTSPATHGVRAPQPVYGRLDQCPPQPRRPLSRDPPTPIPIGTRVARGTTPA